MMQANFATERTQHFSKWGSESNWQLAVGKTKSNGNGKTFLPRINANEREYKAKTKDKAFSIQVFVKNVIREDQKDQR